MNKHKIYLGLILFGLGLVGISSMLTMDIPLPAEAAAILKESFSAQQIKLLLLINPIIILTVAVIVGISLYQQVNLRVPIIENLLGKEQQDLNTTNILKYGIGGGIIAGALLSLIAYLFDPILPTELKELSETIKPTLAARFLYGGLTEEILMRFGLMTLTVWIASKLFKGTSTMVYWIGILIAAVIFAFGHFPIAFQAVENPSTGLLAYILLGNTIGGIIFGWLYWKKGLESAFLAHIFAHVVMVYVESLMNY